MRTIFRISAIAMLFSWAGLAQAGVICDASIAGKVTPNMGCETGSANNDSEAQVNADLMFGYDDWLFAQKDDDLDGTDETNIDIGFALVGNLLSGEWSIDDIWGLYDSVMIVVKGGAGNISPDVYVGYLIEFGETMGSYDTPFVSGAGPDQNPADISHISVYVRGDGQSVPEPGTLALLGLGLVGLGIARRRKLA